MSGLRAEKCSNPEKDFRADQDSRNSRNERNSGNERNSRPEQDFQARRPLRVLHTNMLRGWGGQSNRILTEALGAARWGGCEIALALPHGSELARRARLAGLRVFDDFAFRGPARPWSFWSDVRRLRELLLAKPWDILHLHGSPDTWTAAFALRGFRRAENSAAPPANSAPRRPAVLRTRHNIFPIARHPLNSWLYGQTLDGLIVISRAIERQCAALPFLSAKPTRLIWSIPDMDRFGTSAPGTRERIRRELDTPPDAPVVLCAGRLRLEKGQDIFIRAAVIVHSQMPEAQFWIAGDGSHRAPFEALARELSLESCLRFLGFRQDVPELMASADAGAVPSRSEGLGTAALEALAAGLPTAAANVGGLTDSIIHGETGLLVAPENPQALADALLILLRSPAERQRLAQAGRRLIEEHFTLEALSRKTVEFYREMAAKTTPADINISPPQS